MHVSVLATLVASRISCERGGKRVLSDVSLTVAPKSRLGVVGPNGVGKSTLLGVLAGRVPLDSGTVELAPPESTVGYLGQEPERRPGETVRALFHRLTGVALADQELRQAAEAVSRDDQHAGDSYAVALERWQRLGAGNLDARIDAVMADLSLAPPLADQEMTTLSGGQAARVGLAAIELSSFDITLLDEPTNDLDFEGQARLEGFVRRRPGGMIIVSHDRAFLDSTIDSVLELDGHDHTAKLYRGGWSAYLEERSTVRQHARETYADYASKRRTLLDRARREREWATTGASRERKRPRDHDKAQRDFRLNRTEQLASRARRTDRALSRLQAVEKPWEGWDLRFSIAEASRSGAVVVRLDAAVVQRGGYRLGPIDLEISHGERICLAGPNGSGKTTLIEALLGRTPLASGTRWLGPSVVVGELDQRRSAYAGQASMLSIFTGRTSLEAAAARSLLAKFGLGASHVDRPAGSLSPGERARGELATFQARQVNFLVLDEPTNHLDLPAVEQLEEALASYRGSLLLVSHDRRFVEALDTQRTYDLGERQARGPHA
ncbi:MAG: ABC-F family ATP-binding cassette domain-containing protein [Acidimicrobiales bacterium]